MEPNSSNQTNNASVGHVVLAWNRIRDLNCLVAEVCCDQLDKRIIMVVVEVTSKAEFERRIAAAGSTKLVRVGTPDTSQPVSETYHPGRRGFLRNLVWAL